MWRKKKASRKNCKGRYASNDGCLSSSPTTTTTTKNMDNIFLAADRVLHKYVIRDSEHTERGWEFRNLFVLEATTFNICITVMFVSFWVINRQTHIRPTKGSKITRRQQRRQEKESHFDSHYDNHNDDHDDDTGEETDEFDDEDRDDEQDDGDDNSISIEVDDDGGPEKRSVSRRSKHTQRVNLLSQLAAYDTEKDDDEEDNTKQHNSFSSSFDPTIGDQKEVVDEGTIPLTKEKQDLLQVVKQIKLFSYLTEEAMGLLMEHVQIVNYSSVGQTVFERGCYDGSLYAVLTGSVRVRFHSYPLPNEECSDPDEVQEEHKRVFGSTYRQGEVVTSMLSWLAGMITRVIMTQDGKTHPSIKPSMDYSIMPIAKEISAIALEDNTKLLCVSPTCFAQILDRHPTDVYRIAQTVINRAQRMTVRCLVQTLGLRNELLVVRSSSQNNNNKGLSFPPCTFLPQSKFAQLLAGGKEEHLLKQHATLAFAKLLGIPTLTNASSSESSSVEAIKVLLEYSEIVKLSKGQTLIQTGESHDACYLILDGSMESGLQVPNATNGWEFQSCEKLSTGQLIGEHVCFTGDVSLFTVKSSRNNNGNSTSLTSTTSECTLFKVPRHVYLHILRRYPISMVNALKDILQQISPEVHLLNWTSEWMYVEAAQEVIKRGDPCDSMFVVLNGRLRSAVSSRLRKQDPRLQDLEYGRGKIVGEVGCLTGSNWKYNLYAIRNSEIVRVQMRTLLVIIGAFPTAGLHFARAIAAKVAEHFNPTMAAVSETTTTKRNERSEFRPNTTSVASSKSGFAMSSSPNPHSNIMPSYGLRLATVAIVPLTDSVNIEKFSSSLVNSFNKTIAPCKLATKQIIRGELGEKIYRNRNEMRDLRITRLLADMEENNRIVVYQADEKYTWWTRLCIQQADCILLLVNAERAPGRRRVEQSLEWAHQSIGVRIDLVVVGSPNDEDYREEGEEDNEIDGYDADEEIAVSDQLNNWSERRKWISGHHLIRKPFRYYPMDFQRMCRRVSGRAVGLVLGGGGARGLAHVGVIKALKEAGVTVDIVGGTSQGAFVGAIFSRQPDDYELVKERCRKMAKEMSSVKNKLFDLTLPMTSIFCGRLFNRGIRKQLGKIRIQDLVLNFFCVSVDLQKQRQVIHTKGVLWKYCRASMSLTGYLPPVAENGSLLVDGGYMNALPADVMRHQMNARMVISVDVSKESDRDYFDYGASLSGWWLLFNSWNPFAKTVKVPSMGDISDMLIWVSSLQHLRNVKMTSDLHLAPPVQDVGTLEYDRFDEIVQTGYMYAKPLVEEFVRKHPWVVTDAPVRKAGFASSASLTK